MIFPIRQYGNPQNQQPQQQTQTPTNKSIESPFDPFQINTSSSTFAVYIEPIRNAYYKTYQHVITFDAPPAGPLSNMVISINTPPLSEFQRSTSSLSPPTTRNGGRCIYVLSRYPKGSPHANPKHSNAYMTPRDIPALYGFLRTNGYTIDTTLTKMTYQSNTASYIMMDEDNGYGHRKLVAIVTYPV